MAHESITDLTESNFEDFVKESSVPVLVDFWAPWCGPCRQLTPILEEIATAEGDAVKIAKVNVDDAQQLAAKFGINGIPYMQFYKDGEVKNTHQGLASKPALLEKLNALK